MKRQATKILAVILLLAVIAGGAFMVGGVVGFAYGFSMQPALTSPSDALVLVHILKRLRQGQHDAVLRSLEGQLDTLIVEHGLFLRRGDPVFDFFRFGDYAPGFMYEVAQYRQEFPASASDEELREHLQSILANYATKPESPNKRDAGRPGPRSGSDGDERARSGPGA